MTPTPPRRVQRSRKKGSRMPEGAVYVGRPTVWGNQWAHGRLATRVALFREEAVERAKRDPDWLSPLRGRDLVCWCPLDKPCHADVLLELANLPAAPKPDALDRAIAKIGQEAVPDDIYPEVMRRIRRARFWAMLSYARSLRKAGYPRSVIFGPYR